MEKKERWQQKKKKYQPPTWIYFERDTNTEERNSIECGIVNCISPFKHSILTLFWFCLYWSLKLDSSQAAAKKHSLDTGLVYDMDSDV